MLLFIVFSFVVVEPFLMSSAWGIEVVQKKECYNKHGFKLDPERSLVFSVLTLCLPGILNRIHELNQIQCKKVVCMYEAIKAGVDPSYCEEVAGYEECVFVVQEALIDQVIDQVRGIVDDFLKDPTLYVASAVVSAARCVAKYQCCAGTTLTGFCGKIMGSQGKGGGGKACSLWGITLGVVDLTESLGKIDRLVTTAKHFFSSVKDREDYCDKIDDIEKEVDDILNN